MFPYFRRSLWDLRSKPYLYDRSPYRHKSDRFCPSNAIINLKNDRFAPCFLNPRRIVPTLKEWQVAIRVKLLIVLAYRSFLAMIF